MPVAQPERMDWIVRGLALGGFAGLISGLVAGPGARLAMRIFAVATDRPTEFTFAGTMVIVTFGLIFGPAVAVGYVLARQVLPGPWPLRAVVFGLALAGVVVIASNGAPIDEALPNPTLGTSLFATLAFVVGLVTTGAVTWLDRRIAVPVQDPGRITGAGALIGVVGALLLFFLLASAVIGLVA